MTKSLQSSKKMVIQDERVIKSVHKTDAEKGGAVGQMLTIADKGGRGGLEPPISG